MSFSELKNAICVEDAITRAGHRFEVEKREIFFDRGEEHQPFDAVSIPEHRATVRVDTNEPLGIVGRKYEVHQPQETWDFVDQFLKISGGKLDRGLTLDNGRTIGVSVNLGDREYIKGDRITNNFLIIDTFDGTKSFCGRGISQRWFCMNQLPHSQKFFNIRHTRNMEYRIGQAGQMLNWYSGEQNVFDEKMNFLAGQQLSKEDSVRWFASLFPEPKTDISKTKMINNMTKYAILLSEGKGVQELSGMEGTAYNSLNALTEFVNHHSTIRVAKGKREDETRFRSVIFGTGSKLMQKGFDSLLKAVA
jgi:phage/plasmid-like protein (TIGR03299 family)